MFSVSTSINSNQGFGVSFERLTREERESTAVEMGNKEVFFVFMNYDPQYERLLRDRSKKGAEELDSYLSNKHDQLLAKMLQPNTYKKRSSLAIVDGFAVEITQEQASILRTAKEVRLVEKNQELA